MTWNPFQYQFAAIFLEEEGDYAVLEIQRGSEKAVFRFPKKFLPPTVERGSSFTLKLEDPETARSSEIQTLRQLLNELIQ